MVKFDIFISYSRKDKKTVMEFCEELSKAGISYWLDKDGISNGEQFKTVIVKAIEESAVFVFCSTLNSNASDWTAKEIGIAVARGKHIIPVKFDSSPYNRSVEFDLVNIDFVDCTSKSAKEKAMPKLIETIRTKSSKVEKELGQTTFPVYSEKRSLSNQFKMIVAAVIVGVMGIFVYLLWPPKPIPPIPDRFLIAYKQLNSNLTDSVKYGYELMHRLAAEGDCRAKTEIGITNFSLTPKEDKTKEYRTDSILQRRKHLGMVDGSLDELSKSLQYLSSVADSVAIYPENYYILGMIYFNQKNYSQALDAFKHSLELMNKGYHVAHGYEAGDLRRRLENNIEKLQGN